MPERPQLREHQQRPQLCEEETEQHTETLMSPFFPVNASGDANSSQPSTPVQPIVELCTPDEERPHEEPSISIASPAYSPNAHVLQEEASLQLGVLRSALMDLQHRLDPDQGMSNLEHMRGTLVLAQRGLAVLERCQRL